MNTRDTVNQLIDAIIQQAAQKHSLDTSSARAFALGYISQELMNCIDDMPVTKRVKTLARLQQTIENTTNKQL